MSEKSPLFYEPTTAITDFIIFGLGAGFGFLSLPDSTSLFQLLWAFAFFSVGMGGLLGGITHGIGPKISENAKRIIWQLTLIFVGLTGLLLGMSGVVYFVPKSITTWFIGGAGVIFILYIFWIVEHDTFHAAVKFYLPLMLIALIGFGVMAFSYQYTGALLIVMGLIVSLAASAVQMMKISFHQHFNHNDLFHVIQMVGMVLLYRGGMEMPII